ncbi:MAG: hypothetical protein NZ742_12295, partial [Acidobacteria bacterium]|nr:hypothetical protein [Acidobacteriota bacterium]MDW7985463.1 hypothetical protein [Acidobacteriota bacterium]
GSTMREWQVEKVLEDHGHGRIELVRDAWTGLTYQRTVWAPDGPLSSVVSNPNFWQALREVPGFPPMLYGEAQESSLVAIARPVVGLSLLEACGRIRMVEGLRLGVLLPVPVTVVVLRDVVRSLMVLEGHGYVYRALHPRWVVVDSTAERVWLTRPGCVAPLGDAAGDGSNIDLAPDGLGCLHELTPPEWSGRSWTPAWDAFAVGGLMAFCITGQYPQRMDPSGRPVFLRREVTALIDGAVERLRTVQAPELGSILEGTLREEPQERMSLPVLHERLVGFLIRHRVSETYVWLALGRLTPASGVPPVTYARAWQYVRHDWATPYKEPVPEAAAETSPPADSRPSWRRRLRDLFS